MSPDNREPFGVAVRQRAEQKSVDNAENGGVGTDAEREREHGHGGEAGVLQQLAEGVAKVTKHNKEATSEFHEADEASGSIGIPGYPGTVHDMVQTGARDRIHLL